jgi:hypothetical protein
MDPYEAYAAAAAEERERRKQDREPGIWMPDSEHLDSDELPPDQERPRLRE